MHLQDMTPDGVSADALLEVSRLATAGQLRPYAVKRLTRDGRTLDVLLTATALVNESGEMYAIATTERELCAGEPDDRDGTAR